MKNTLIFFSLFSFITFLTSCSKDQPVSFSASNVLKYDSSAENDLMSRFRPIGGTTAQLYIENISPYKDVLTDIVLKEKDYSYNNISLENIKIKDIFLQLTSFNSNVIPLLIDCNLILKKKTASGFYEDIIIGTYVPQSDDSTILKFTLNNDNLVDLLNDESNYYLFEFNFSENPDEEILFAKYQLSFDYVYGISSED